jgi:uncharacterized protein (TIGR03382 family)
MATGTGTGMATGTGTGMATGTGTGATGTGTGATGTGTGDPIPGGDSGGDSAGKADCGDCNATGGVFGGWLGLVLALALVGRRRED